MIKFFRSPDNRIYAVQVSENLDKEQEEKLVWLFGNASPLSDSSLKGTFIGPRKEMITPWSTNAVEITVNMGIDGITRIEEFFPSQNREHDPMLEVVYEMLDQDIYTIEKAPDPIIPVDDISSYNQQEGLALSDEEIDYLEDVSQQLGRPLTDSEVFGFSQVNSEHCRHKIFNGQFIIDGEEKKLSLFQHIKKTSKEHPNFIISAYSDNVAFIKGPVIDQFAPQRQDIAGFFSTETIESVLSLKAETHNFPTTVEPFNGAATGSGGEIRDRLAGGKGSLPLAGTAVYMTSYPRLEEGRMWESDIPAREWLYQTPLDILIKASDGASDFGNKFGQPLIAGSLLTFENLSEAKKYGYDKVIMLAGGIGFARKEDSLKGKVKKGDEVVILGGDNYRIGMGGGAVSSVATGEFANAIELNAVQRSNPEMQKRAMNVIRALQEMKENPIVSIHDHGAGGHLNCLSELLEETGGEIEIDKLPVGDPTLSEKEIIGNESQERMGLVFKSKDLPLVQRIAERERSPYYPVGHATGDMNFRFIGKGNQNPIDWELAHMFGSSPSTILKDSTERIEREKLQFDTEKFTYYLDQLLQMEAVACKDWLTNKVDRSVTGKVATQQTCGEIQLPLNNVGVMALDFTSHKGVATSIGHSPVSALTDPGAGSRLSIAESLTNLVWAPLTKGLKGVSLSANWMWPAKVNGENARLYSAVEAAGEFATALGINIPTGKDSLSMTQKYPDGETVYAPGTVIISTVAEVEDVRKTVSPDLKDEKESFIYHVDFSGVGSCLGGSSFSQLLGKIAVNVPDIGNPGEFIKRFSRLQDLVSEGQIIAGHDIGSGGLITSLLEMCFPTRKMGMEIHLDLPMGKLMRMLLAENPGVVFQAGSSVENLLNESDVSFQRLGKVNNERKFMIHSGGETIDLDINDLRDSWFKTSYLFDKHQRTEVCSIDRFNNYADQPLEYKFPKDFKGQLAEYGLHTKRDSESGIRAAIIREKGVNGDREMAWSMYLAGFDVKDVHMTDLISGREDLSDVNFIVFVGGFSNSDVLGSAKGWAGAFQYNTKARTALENFYQREDTISLGVCNGCQLMMELGLIQEEKWNHPTMKHNSSGKFESSFVSLDIPNNNSVFLKSLSGTRLGVWLAHGEGRFDLPKEESHYNIVAQYHYSDYPGNPNGSDYAAAALSSANGRHLAIMPHLERSIYPWNWPHYPESKHEHQISPWLEAFVNARKWVMEATK